MTTTPEQEGVEWAPERGDGYDPPTWRKLETWIDNACVMGDECVSDVHVALYGRGAERFQMSFYVERFEDGSLGVREQDMHWTIEMHGEDDYGRDCAEVDYPDGPSVLAYEDVESAEAICKRAAERDDTEYLS